MIRAPPPARGLVRDSEHGEVDLDLLYAKTERYVAQITGFGFKFDRTEAQVVDFIVHSYEGFGPVKTKYQAGQAFNKIMFRLRQL